MRKNRLSIQHAGTPYQTIFSKVIPYSEELFKRREGEGKLLYYSQSLTEAKAKQMRRGRRVVLWPGLEQPEPAIATHN